MNQAVFVLINVLVSLIKTGIMAQYITKNQAPRDVYKLLLTEGRKRTKASVNELFRGALESQFRCSGSDGYLV